MHAEILLEKKKINYILDKVVSPFVCNSLHDDFSMPWDTFLFYIPFADHEGYPNSEAVYTKFDR
jgi:hypothetical protein